MIQQVPEFEAQEMYSDYCEECIAEGVVPLTCAEWLRDEQIEPV